MLLLTTLSKDTALADRLRFMYLGEGALGPDLDVQMMLLASDTMYQAGSKTLLDLAVQQNTTFNTYQVGIFSRSNQLCPVPLFLCGYHLVIVSLVRGLPTGIRRLPCGRSSLPLLPCPKSTYH